MTRNDLHPAAKIFNTVARQKHGERCEACACFVDDNIDKDVMDFVIVWAGKQLPFSIENSNAEDTHGWNKKFMKEVQTWFKRSGKSRVSTGTTKY